jgi:hypothetical protein
MNELLKGAPAPLSSTVACGEAPAGSVAIEPVSRITRNPTHEDGEYEELNELYEDLDEYFNSKTFAKTLKNLNITDTVRKSAGIFYTGIKAENADVSKKQLIEIQPYNVSQCLNSSEFLANDGMDDCQYAKWE